MAELDPRTTDKRILERRIRKGELTEKEVEKGLKGMADVAEEGAVVEAKLEHVETDED